MHYWVVFQIQTELEGRWSRLSQCHYVLEVFFIWSCLAFWLLLGLHCDSLLLLNWTLHSYPITSIIKVPYHFFYFASHAHCWSYGFVPGLWAAWCVSVFVTLQNRIKLLTRAWLRFYELIWPNNGTLQQWFSNGATCTSRDTVEYCKGFSDFIF